MTKLHQISKELESLLSCFLRAWYRSIWEQESLLGKWNIIRSVMTSIRQNGKEKEQRHGKWSRKCSYFLKKNENTAFKKGCLQNLTEVKDYCLNVTPHYGAGMEEPCISSTVRITLTESTGLILLQAHIWEIQQLSHEMLNRKPTEKKPNCSSV